MKFCCANCQAKYQIGDDKVAGKTVRMKCRKCGSEIIVRPGEGLPDDAAVGAAPAPAPRDPPFNVTSSALVSPLAPPRAAEPAAKPDDDATSIMSFPSQSGAPVVAAAAPDRTPAAPAVPIARTPLTRTAVPAPGPAASTTPAAARPAVPAPAPRPLAGTAPAPRPPAGAAPVAGAALPPRPAAAPRPIAAPAPIRPIAPAPPPPAAPVPRPLPGAAPRPLPAASSPLKPAVKPSDDYYVGIGGVPLGPVKLAVIRDKALAGAVDAESLVWKEGLAEWQPLKTFPELLHAVEGAQAARRSTGTMPAVSLDAAPALAPPALPNVAPQPAPRAESTASRPLRSLGVAPLPKIAPPPKPSSPSISAPVKPAAIEAVSEPKPPPDAETPAISVAPVPSLGGASGPFAPSAPTPAIAPVSRAIVEEPISRGTVPMDAPGSGPVPSPFASAHLPQPPPPSSDKPKASSGLGVVVDPFGAPPPPASKPSLGVNAGAPLGTDTSVAPSALSSAADVKAFGSGPSSVPIPPDAAIPPSRAASTSSTALVKETSDDDIDEPIRLKRSSGPNPLAYAFIAAAAVFGGVAAYVIFSKQPTTQIVVVQQAASGPLPVTGPSGEPKAQVEVGEPVPGTTATGKSPSGVVGPRPKATTTTTGTTPPPSAPLDTSGFQSQVPGPTNTPPPGGGAGAGQLSQSEISQVVSQNQAGVKRRCWQPALEARSANAPSTARVKARIVIGASGNVESVSANGAENDYPGLSACIAQRIQNWKFPASGGPTTVEVPFVFAGQ